MKFLVLIVAVAALTTAAIFGLSASSTASDGDAAPTAGRFFTVERDDLLILLTENGTLVAKDSKKVVPTYRGRCQITWLVEEGKRLTENEVICKLDGTALETRMRTIEKEIVSWDSSLKKVMTDVEIQELEAQGALEKAEDAIQKAKMYLERYRDGDAPQDKRLLEIDIKDTETEFSQAKKRYEDSQTLLKQDYIRKSELAEHKIQFERAQARLEGSQLALKLWKKYSYPMTIKESETDLNNAIRELATTKKRNSSKLRQKNVLVQQAEKRLKSAQEQLKKRKKELAGMTLTAPCPGILLYGDPRHNWMRSEIKVGGNIWGGNTLFTIPDLRIMQVRIQVHEADINKLKVGQQTNVTMDTYPGLVLKGKVSKIASIAGGAIRMYNPSTASVKKFAVEITLTTKTEATLKPGISAKAEIHIDKLEDVLFVPLQCIFLENGVHYCYVADKDQRAVKREIKVGLMNDTYVEVTEGLEPGAHVLLYNPNLPAEKEKTDKDKDDKKKEADGDKKPKVPGSGTAGN